MSVTGRIARCCERHEDWNTLGEHLATDFPTVAVGDLLRVLTAARTAIEPFTLDEAEALDTVELITRQQLMLRTGQTVDVARLDPETHARRRDTPQVEPV